MSVTIRNGLPTVAVILFFASSLCAALWDMEIDLRRFSEDFAGDLMRTGNGEPGRMFGENLHCLSKVAQGEHLTIVADIVNPIRSADFEVTFWDEKRYESSMHSVSPNTTLCSEKTRAHVRDTTQVACSVSAPRQDSLWRVIVWAVSSEDVANITTSRMPNSYFGICQ